MIKRSIVCDHGNLSRQCPICEATIELAQLSQANDRLYKALCHAETALTDIGQEGENDLEWCQKRAAKALPVVEQALHCHVR
jgi:hypothetical protein